MKKYSKILVGALALTIILIVTITGVAAAAGPYYEDCPRECEGSNGGGGQYNGNCQGDCDRECDGDCTCDCECQCDGDCQCGYQTLSETESLEGESGTQTMAQVCNDVCEQNRKNYQSGENGNCNSIQHSNNYQYKYGAD